MFQGISRWQQSGLTQKAWCEKNNVAYATFHYWYKKYRSEEQEPSIECSDGGGFVQLMVDSPSASAWCELLLGEGKKLVFHQAVSVEFMRALIG
jgi:hypothetical protein